MREFLQNTVVQRYRERRDTESVSLGRNVLGLVFEEDDGQFFDLPSLDWVEIKSETAMVVAWLAGQAQDEWLFGIALKKLRELDGPSPHPLAHLYRLHAECMGRRFFGRQIAGHAPFDCKPRAAHQALQGRFRSLPPLPNVVRAINLSFVQSSVDDHPDFDRTPCQGAMTLHQSLVAIRDEGLRDEIRIDDGFVVGSVAIIEAATRYYEKSCSLNDADAARRCYSAACEAYAKLLFRYRAGKINKSPNAKDMVVKADDSFRELLALVDKFVDGT